MDTTSEYKIVLWTWYQEIPNELQREELKENTFNNFKDAINYLNQNIDRLSDEFPISKIEIY